MAIDLDIDVGDIVLTGKFKNKRTVVKKIGRDKELNQPTVNDKNLLNMRIEKDLPIDKQSKKTREKEPNTVKKLTTEELKQMIREQMHPRTGRPDEVKILQKLGFEFAKYGGTSWTKALPRPWMGDIWIVFDQEKDMWSLSVGGYEDSVLEIKDVSLRTLLSMYNKLITDITIG